MRTASSLILTLLLASAPAAMADDKARWNAEFDACTKAGGYFLPCIEHLSALHGGACEPLLAQFRRQFAQAAKQGVTLAFAGRKADTPTGMRGCGYAWAEDAEQAEREAMKGCRKSEVRYGTGNGDRVCALIDLSLPDQ